MQWLNNLYYLLLPVAVPLIPVLQAQQLNFPGLRVHLDTDPRGCVSVKEG